MKYKWTVEIEVDPIWVADGIDLTSERMHEILMTYYGHVYSHEITCKTVKAPNPKRIRKEQGYRDD